jgi:hypothetical protein
LNIGRFLALCRRSANVLSENFMKNPFGPKPLVLGLLAAFALVSATPEDASAQLSRRAKAKPAAAAAAAAPPGLDRERGGKEAPAAVAGARLACTVVDAALVGTSDAPVNGVAVTRNVYEVACQDGLGHMVFAPQQPGGPGAEAIDCLIVQANQRLAEAKGQGQSALACRLPGNAQAAQGLRSYVAQAGGDACTINNARYLGALNGASMLRYEVGCAEGAGFVLDRPVVGGGKPTRLSCLSVIGTNSTCQFTTQAQTFASLNPAVAQARRDCTVANARPAGRNPTTQAEVFEIGCSGGKPGFFVELSGAGQYVRTIECGAIRNTPCQFTSGESLENARKDDFTRRLRANGVDCAVGQLRYIGAEANGRDIFEAACTNRPEGVYALLPAQGTANAEVYDCLLATTRGAACQLTQPSVLYPRLTSAVAGRLTNPCTVNGARSLGSTREGENFYELACADGRQFIVDYAGNGRIKQFLNCREASGILGGCRAGPTGSISRNR